MNQNPFVQRSTRPLNALQNDLVIATAQTLLRDHALREQLQAQVEYLAQEFGWPPRTMAYHRLKKILISAIQAS